MNSFLWTWFTLCFVSFVLNALVVRGYFLWSIVLHYFPKFGTVQLSLPHAPLLKLWENTWCIHTKRTFCRCTARKTILFSCVVKLLSISHMRTAMKIEQQRNLPFDLECYNDNNLLIAADSFKIQHYSYCSQGFHFLITHGKRKINAWKVFP